MNEQWKKTTSYKEHKKAQEVNSYGEVGISTGNYRENSGHF